MTELDAGRMTFFEHLAELRSRIMRIAAAVLVGATVCFLLYETIVGWLVKPYCDTLPVEESAAGILTRGRCGLLVTDPLEGFGLRMTISAYGGIILAVPVILWQLWRFIAPGLYKHEKRFALPFMFVGVVLFALGAGLAYWTLPRALEFLIEIGGPDLVTVYSARPYLSLVVKMMVAFGVGFEFPVLLAFLQMLNIVTPKKLASVRRYAIVGIVVLVAVITPSGDPVSLLVLSVPMAIFYEASILYGRLWQRRKRRARGVAATGTT
jgi:sec-independent protein translocase protein TatC